MENQISEEFEKWWKEEYEYKHMPDEYRILAEAAFNKGALVGATKASEIAINLAKTLFSKDAFK
jgi:hypothetical protein